jgi:hypothetical protein
MVDYESLLRRVLADLDLRTAESRRALYDRTRATQTKQLRILVPPLTERDSQRERLALEDAIVKIEDEARFDEILASPPSSTARGEIKQQIWAQLVPFPDSAPEISDRTPPVVQKLLDFLSTWTAKVP